MSQTAELCPVSNSAGPAFPSYLRLALLVLIMAAAVAGCGYKGPLYMPKPVSGKPPPVVMPEPAPKRPVPAEAAPAPK
jgi:predicted small lipoprotein YifL